MNWSEISSEIMKAVIIAAVPLISAGLAWGLSWLTTWIKNHVTNQWVQRIALEAVEITRALNQTLVGPAKEAAKDGKLSEAEKQQFKQLAIKALLDRLKGAPGHLLGDLEKRASDAIEAAIAGDKPANPQ